MANFFSQNKEATTTNSSNKGGIYAGINLSSLGFGLHGVYSINDKFNVRLSGNFLKFNLNKNFKEGNNVMTDNSSKVTFTTIGLLCDYNPFKTNSAFRISAGLFLNLNKINVSRIYTYDDGSIKEDLGKLDVNITFPKISPYLGLVFGKYKETRKLNLFFELGMLYHGKPKVEFLGEGRVAPTAEQQPILDENLKGYRFLPNINLHLNYKIK
jgi:hypothetical protein